MKQVSIQMQKGSNYDYLIKLLVIGDSGVGKTNMLLRFCQNTFVSSHLSTIGIDFKIKTVSIGEDRVRLQIWDTAGQQRFKTITQTYYRGAMGIILTYAVNEKDSFINVKNWIKQIKVHSNDSVVKILVANKCELTQREVSVEEGRNFAQANGMQFYQCSAKENINIEKIFLHIAQIIKEQMPADQKEILGFNKKNDKQQQKEQKCC